MCVREKRLCGGVLKVRVHAQRLCGDSVPCGIVGGIMITLNNNNDDDNI